MGGGGYICKGELLLLLLYYMNVVNLTRSENPLPQWSSSTPIGGDVQELEFKISSYINVVDLTRSENPLPQWSSSIQLEVDVPG
jgi:hypothetical protein